MSKLVVLDTGLYGDCVGELHALGEYLDLPWQIIPVGLDMLRFHLERLVLSLGQQAQPAPLPARPLLSRLPDGNGDTGRPTHRWRRGRSPAQGRGGIPAALSSRETGVLGPRTRVPHARLDPDEGFRWTAARNGFLIRLKYRDQDLGLLELNKLAFAQYKERYLNLALPLVRVCALALANASALEACQRPSRPS